MNHRLRRKRNRNAFMLAAVVLAAGAGGARWFGDGERVAAMWVTAELDETGVGRIHEVIDYEFGHNQRHGIYRDVPGLDPEAAVRVSSADAPDDVSIEPSFATNNVRIRIGDPNETISGQHRYVLRYPLNGILDETEVAWDAVGSLWDVQIGPVEVHLTAPFSLDDPRCVEGTGFGEPCPIAESEPGHLVATVDGGLEPGEGATIYATAGEALSAAPAAPSPPDPPDDPAPPPLVYAAVAGVPALLAAIGAARLLRRAGRERAWVGSAAEVAFGPNAPIAKEGDTSGGDERPARHELHEWLIDHDDLAELATIEFAPPTGITPAEGGVLLAEHVTRDHQVAWLFDAAARGAIDIDGSEGHIVLRELDLSRAPDMAGPLHQLFTTNDKTCDLGGYRQEFATMWARLRADLDVWLHFAGLWDPKGDARRSKTRTLATFVAIAGVIVLLGAAYVGAQAGPGWLVAAALGAVMAGAGTAALVASWELRVRTPEGTGLWLRVESFRRFLEASEGEHARQAAERGVLREYTAWAIAVGELHHWTAAVDAAALPPNLAAEVGAVRAAPLLWSSTTTASTPPQSTSSDSWTSSSSGSFSGGVGGGAGGGGGGSW